MSPTKKPFHLLSPLVWTIHVRVWTPGQSVASWLTSSPFHRRFSGWRGSSSTCPGRTESPRPPSRVEYHYSARFVWLATLVTQVWWVIKPSRSQLTGFWSQLRFTLSFRQDDFQISGIFLQLFCRTWRRHHQLQKRGFNVQSNPATPVLVDSTCFSGRLHLFLPEGLRRSAWRAHPHLVRIRLWLVYKDCGHWYHWLSCVALGHLGLKSQPIA